MVAWVEDYYAHKDVCVEVSLVALELWCCAGEDQVMEDDCFVYKCSFYEQELLVVLVQVVREHVDVKEQGEELYYDDLVLQYNINTL